jgi:hypothetical protein
MREAAHCDFLRRRAERLPDETGWSAPGFSGIPYSGSDVRGALINIHAVGDAPTDVI